MVALGMHRRLESEYRKPPMHPGVAESSDYPRDVEIGLDGAIVIYRYSRVCREYAHIDRDTIVEATYTRERDCPIITAKCQHVAENFPFTSIADEWRRALKSEQYRDTLQ